MDGITKPMACFQNGRWFAPTIPSIEVSNHEAVEDIFAASKMGHFN